MNCKKKVLLVNAPLEELCFNEKWEKTELLTPPLGLMYLAYPLIKAGYLVSFIDLNIERIPKKEFIDILKDKDFFLFYCYTFSLKNVVKIIKMIRSVNNSGYIMCGGPYCNFTQKYVTGSDLTVIGEAEEIIVSLLNRVSGKKSLSQIPGLIYRKNGSVIRNPGILEVKNIDQSRHSAWELTRNKEYGYFLGYKIKNVTGMICSRGCPYKCNFCTNKGIISHRKRSAENVINELKHIQKKGFKYVVFYDEHFLLNKMWVLDIMNGIIREKIKLKFVLQSRVNAVDSQVLKILRKAGVIAIIYGIENANQDVLDFYNKNIDLDMINRAISMSNKLGFFTCGFFLLGSPLENETHLETNRKFIKSVPLDYININILRYYEGTQLWADAYKAGIIKENETTVYANERLSHFSYNEWLHYKDILLREYYSNASRVVRLVCKCIRFGLFPLAVRTLWHSKKSFFIKTANPFMPVDKDEKIKVSEHE